MSDTGSAWPEAFLADFESRTWMTYRSHFAPIPRSNNPEATSSMTLGVRLRSQLMDSQGFTSDTGWGCMIRSGQGLLANALCILEFGRGEQSPLSKAKMAETGNADHDHRMAKRAAHRRRVKAVGHVCRSSRSPILYTSLCPVRSRIMWEIPRGVVWTLGHCSMYPVSTPPTSIATRAPQEIPES